MKSSIEHIGQFFFNQIADRIIVVSCAEMRSDNKFVFEYCPAFYDVIEVQVPELMYLLPPMVR